ncbi:hypothetical protein PHO31112_05107 [Pandoraea horticolens]|uniref:Nucleotidyl transferase AbiEii/AbiGii toxin family protein n=1 Tax=Pandoraea horticolens TaxID=2508298 RepID=A0A5E4Z7B5_9BURK|nr:nucleotidyl transferase AbiEii/AbiGii toxin family protein [Pandoraea horticolens]VVE56668.1 hypothetical protein PHO31112_05107 [Pandoraea horticolens]
MAEYFFDLNRNEQYEALEFAREQSGRPAHLLEKDVWVVWVLRALFDSPLAADLTFKGGTSLSKAYRLIDRFSEDVDLTYDIRRLIPDLIPEGKFLPSSRSQSSKWTAAVRRELPAWVNNHVLPVITSALAEEELDATIELTGKDSDTVLLRYSALSSGTGYVSPVVKLEFGGRATGEPHMEMPVRCDIAGLLEGVTFPEAKPVVMSLSRTFWEKATAAHVYCAQGRIRGERYARHWHDLVSIADSAKFDALLTDVDVASVVAEHKSCFFIEKDGDGKTIDYRHAVSGGLCIVPTDAARDALAKDYSAMIEDNVLVGGDVTFDELMAKCVGIQDTLNRIMASNKAS